MCDALGQRHQHASEGRNEPNQRNQRQKQEFDNAVFLRMGHDSPPKSNSSNLTHFSSMFLLNNDFCDELKSQ